MIGTGGRGAVALRFDDAPAEFRENVLPLLAERNLPFTRVLTSESVHGTPHPVGEFARMQEYCLAYGGEVWNHGRNHGDASGEELEPEILGALEALRAEMPQLPVDCFAPPGGGSISYDGQMPSRSIEQWDTPAGELILRSHAIAGGYLPDTYYRPLDGQLRDGQIHYSCDPYSSGSTKLLIDRARDWGVGMVMMWHPHNLDRGSNMTTADFVATLEHLVAQRDAGNILVLTASGLGVADRHSTARDDALSTHGTGRPFQENVQFPQYRQNLPGSTRELVATVTGTAGQRITAEVGETSREYTVPASGTLHLRHLVTLPQDIRKLTVKITGRCTDVHLYAV